MHKIEAGEIGSGAGPIPNEPGVHSSKTGVTGFNIPSTFGTAGTGFGGGDAGTTGDTGIRTGPGKNESTAHMSLGQKFKAVIPGTKENKEKKAIEGREKRAAF